VSGKRGSSGLHPSGERGRPHPALLTLVLACARDPSALLRPKELERLYAELGFRIGERQLRNHARWLIERGYIEIRVWKRGRRVELTEKALNLLGSLGLKEVRAPCGP
jgi:repressor of nif and glnA expression